MPTVGNHPQHPDIMMRRLIAHSALAIGNTVLWGLIELIALLRSRWAAPYRQRRLPARPRG